MQKTPVHGATARRRLLALAVGTLAALAGAPAGAQQLEEIVVTAQKREESLQDVPISVSAVSGEKIADAGIQRFGDLAAYVPNFSVTKLPIGDSINIRGIQSGTQAGFEQSVATFVDGVYRGRGPQVRNAFVDVSMVEVLRGPQGTLFGKNTVAGALNVRTAKPTDEFEALLSTQYTDEFEELELEAHVSGPISDTLRGRLALLSRESDEGWVHNDFYDNDNPASEELYGRLTLEADLGEATTATLRAERGDFDVDDTVVLQRAGALLALGAVEGDDRANVGASGPVMDTGDAARTYEGDSSEVSLTLETAFEAGTLTGILARSVYDFERFADVDATPLSGIRFDDTEDFEQNSIELRFASEAGGRLDYIAGLYAQEQELVADGLSYFNIPVLQGVLDAGCRAGLGEAYAGVFQPGNPVGTAIGVASLDGPAALASACGQAAAFAGAPGGVERYARLDQQGESWAVFGQGTWHFSDSVRTTLGLRYTDESKDARQSVWATDFLPRNTTPSTDPVVIGLAEGVGEFTTHDFDDLERDEDSLTWSANLQWDATDDLMLYASASTGYKAGGFNSFYMGMARGGGATPDDVDFEEEEVITYELGGKATLLDGAAELNVALFRTEYDDLQASVFSGGTTFVVENAAEATSQGIELDGRWLLSEALTLNASLGYLDFEYDAFPNQACTSDQFLAARDAAYAAAPNAFLKGITALIYNNASCSAAGVNDLAGQSSANAPELTASLGANYEHGIGAYLLRLSLNANYTDDAYRQDDLDPITLDEAHWKIDASAVFGPEDGRWDLALIGRNLADEHSFGFSGDVPLFNGSHLWAPDPPRSFALRARLMF